MEKKSKLRILREDLRYQTSSLLTYINYISYLLTRTQRDKFNFLCAQKARVLSIKLAKDFKKWRKSSMNYTLEYKKKKK